MQQQQQQQQRRPLLLKHRAVAAAAGAGKPQQQQHHQQQVAAAAAGARGKGARQQLWPSHRCLQKRSKQQQRQKLQQQRPQLQPWLRQLLQQALAHQQHASSSSHRPPLVQAGQQRQLQEAPKLCLLAQPLSGLCCSGLQTTMQQQQQEEEEQQGVQVQQQQQQQQQAQVQVQGKVAQWSCCPCCRRDQERPAYQQQLVALRGRLGLCCC
jgi:hypothetical protein